MDGDVKIFEVSSYGRRTFFVPDGARAPRWELITRRVTKDLFTGEVLQDLRHFQKADNEDFFGNFDGPRRDVLFKFTIEKEAHHIIIMAHF